MVQTQSQPGSRPKPPRSAVSSSMTSCPGSIAFASSSSQNHPWPTPTFHFARTRKPFPLSSVERAGVRASFSVLASSVVPKRRRAAALQDALRLRGSQCFAPASWSAPSPLALLPGKPEVSQSSNRLWQVQDRLVNALPSLSQRPSSTTIMSSHGNRFPLSPRERAGVRASVHPLQTQPIKTIHGFGKEMSKFSPRIACVHGDQHNSVYTLKKVFLTWRAKNGAPKPAKTCQNPPKPAIHRDDPHFLKRRVTFASLRWGNPTIIGNRTGVVTFSKLAGKEKVTSW